MRGDSEDFLNLLLWALDRLTHPTLRNVTDSYEAWAYRNGLLGRIRRLEKQGLLKRDASEPDERVYRLTTEGRVRFWGGRDPGQQWSRPWDGRWRMVLFDVPNEHSSYRCLLRRTLRRRGFGRLQRSVWVTPDPLGKEAQVLSGAAVNTHAVILVECQPCGGETDKQIVASAWDFERINRAYERYLKVVQGKPRRTQQDGEAPRAFGQWACAERRAWLDATCLDPLLPAPLLPRQYLGHAAWERRQNLLRHDRFPVPTPLLPRA